MELVETKRGRPCALYLGHGYRQHRRNGEGVVTWLCLKQAIRKCKGRLRSKEDAVLDVSDHQCGPPDPHGLQIKKIICKAKKRAREEATPIQIIYSEELGKLKTEECKLPSETSALRTLYHHRRVWKEPAESWVGHMSEEEYRNWITRREERKTRPQRQKEQKKSTDEEEEESDETRESIVMDAEK